MIDFELPAPIERQVQLIGMLGEQVMRPIARYYDDHEGERPWDYVNMIWPTVRSQGGRTLAAPAVDKKDQASGEKKPRFDNLMLIHTVEALSWGDAGLYLSTPGGALGGAAVEATGTPEQKERFLKRFSEGDPKWAAMAMTEPHAGSDTAAIRTTARLSDDGTEWIINGEKIFVTGGLMSAKESPGFVVVWATLDASAGRAAMKPFVVESGTPGMTVAKLEHKHGIRASDTAALVFQDCRIPVDNLLGSADVARPSDGGAAGGKGFRGAMKTFDATRPAVAASAMGITRATLQFTMAYLKERGVSVRYGVPLHQQTAIERDLLQMEAQHRAAWLLVLNAAAKMDAGQENTLEASMCKVKAGAVANFVAQKAVELLGPEGYSCKLLVEKWMRDARINDIYEGTGQINRLVVARRLLGYSSRELR